MFYLYGEADPTYNWPTDLQHSEIKCDDETTFPRTCYFTISTEEFTSFTIDIVANYAFYDDWTNQPDSSHWRDHVGYFGSGKNFFTMDITTINPCLTTAFLSPPVISQNTVDYFPFVNNTITVPLTWTLDTFGVENLHDRCGPYSLKIK